MVVDTMCRQPSSSYIHLCIGMWNCVQLVALFIAMELHVPLSSHLSLISNKLRRRNRSACDLSTTHLSWLLFIELGMYLYVYDSSNDPKHFFSTVCRLPNISPKSIAIRWQFISTVYSIDILSIVLSFVSSALSDFCLFGFCFSVDRRVTPTQFQMGFISVSDTRSKIICVCDYDFNCIWYVTYVPIQDCWYACNVIHVILRNIICINFVCFVYISSSSITWKTIINSSRLYVVDDGAFNLSIVISNFSRFCAN